MKEGRRSFFYIIFVACIASLWLAILIIDTIITFIPYALFRILFLKKLANAWMWANARFLSRSITYMLGARVTVIGKENLPSSSPDKHCIVANHESYLDITNILGYCKLRTGFIAKHTLGYIPFLNLWMRAFGCSLLKRGGIRSSIQAMNKAVENIKKGVQMVVFPEGTRSKTGEIATFKKGSLKLAFRSKAGIIPIAMVGTRSVLEGRKTIFPRPRIYISILPIVETENMPKEEQDGVAEGLEEAIRAECNRIKATL